MKKITTILITIILAASCTRQGYHADDINNPDNLEYVQEIAFNRDIPVQQVTQQQFNERYNTNFKPNK